MTIRRTASLARVLWYGSLTVGAIVGGIPCAALALRLTRPKEKPC